MGTHILLAAAAGGLFLSPMPSEDSRLIYVGGDCAAAAHQVVAQTGGELLSAQPSGNTCVVTVLVQSNGGRPKKVTVRVPM